MICIEYINASAFEKNAAAVGSTMRKLLRGLKILGGTDEAALIKSQIEGAIQSKAIYGANSGQSRRRRIQS